MKLTIEITGDNLIDVVNALQKVQDRIAVGIVKEQSATDEWWYSYKIKNKRVTVVYGDFIEFGEFKKGDDLYDMAILHEPYQVEEMYEEDIEEQVGGLSWFVLEQFNGEIVTHKNPLVKGVA
jgi:hypothetical protein